MTKKALCVGINDYPNVNNDLNGCVNDAKAWADLLVGHYGFAPADVTLLLDAQATKANIMSALTKMVSEAQPGDVLVFTNSSHGTYVVDTDGDEKTYDEALCPYDCRVNLIVDDELRELFATLADGVNLTVILDSCFSGTATRLDPSLTPDHYLERFIDPGCLDRAAWRSDVLLRAKPSANTKYPESAMPDVLLSGCSEHEKSGDAMIDGVYHGVMTHYALKAVREADFRIRLKDLVVRVNELIAEETNHSQTPQLEGRDANKASYLFSAPGEAGAFGSDAVTSRG